MSIIMTSRIVCLIIIVLIKSMECLPAEESSTRYTFYEGLEKVLLKNENNTSLKYSNCSHFLDDHRQRRTLKIIPCDNISNQYINELKVDSRKLNRIPTKKVSALKKTIAKNNYTSVINTNSSKDSWLTPVYLKTKFVLPTPKSTKKSSAKPIKITTSKISSLFSTVSPNKTKYKVIKNTSTVRFNTTKANNPKKPLITSTIITNKTKPLKLKKQKPTIHKIVTKWKDKTDLTSLKQNLYKQNYPFPTPNPEITSSSPSFSLSDFGPIPSLGTVEDASSNLNIMPEVSSYSPPYSLSGVPDLSQLTPIETFQPLTNAGTPSKPLSTIKLDMIPGSGGTNDINSPCPTIHISSSLLQPNIRQECSDLNLVINSHFQQNPTDTRFPVASTYDSEPEAVEAAFDPVVEAVESDPVGAVADPGVGSAQSVVPQTVGTAGSGGSGGSGGTGGNGDNGPWRFPDLTHMFEAVGYLWRGLSYLFGFLRNPYLYLVPMALFFVLGFLKVMALFPWWIPLLILYISVKSGNKPKQAVSFYKHVHKPIKHLDGWFWNHKTKTWQNVKDYVYKRKHDVGNASSDPNDSLAEDLWRIHKLYNSTSDRHKRFRRRS